MIFSTFEYHFLQMAAKNSERGPGHWIYGFNLSSPSGLTVLVSIAAVFLLSILDLTGWIFNIPVLKSVLSEWGPMKIITALCFILTSSALLAIQVMKPERRGVRILLSAVATLISIIGIITIFEYLRIFKAGNESQLSGSFLFSLFLSEPNRMALVTAINFTLTGIVVLLLVQGHERSINVAHLVILPVALISYIVPVSYLLDVYSIHDFADIPVALNTGLAFCGICLAILFLRPDSWFLKGFTSVNTGGMIARKLLPPLMILPVVIGWMRIQGERRGFFESDEGVVFVAATYTLCFLVLVWLTARSVNAIDKKRLASDEALKRSHENLEKRILERTSELSKLNKALDSEILERIKAQATVEAERKRTTDLLEMMPAYVILLTPDYHVAYANRYFREQFGEDQGRRCYEYLFNRTEPCEICETYKVLKVNRPLTWEWTGPNGRDYSIFDFPFTDTDGSGLIMEMGIDVTELKQAEAKLKELNNELEQRVAARTKDLLKSRQEWIETFDMIPDLIAIIDKDHKIIRANKSMLKKLNISPEDAAGSRCYSCMHGTTSPPENCPHTLSLNDGKNHIAEIHEEKLGGDFLVTDTPIFDEAGSYIGSVHVARDITERKNVEKQIEKYSHRLEIMSETASRLLISGSTQEHLNELCERVMKYLDCQVFFNFVVDDNTDKLHLNTCSGIPDDTVRKIKWLDFGKAVCDCVVRDGERIVAENIPDTPDPGTELIRSFGLKAYACHPLLSRGKVIGTLSFGTRTRTTFSDDDLSLMKVVSDQVAFAMGRMKDEQALRESEDRLRTIAESLPVQIMISRVADDTILFTNEAYDNAFGYKPGELTGKKTPDIYFDPEDREKVLALLNERRLLANAEFKVKKSDGTPFWTMVSIQRITYGGEPAYLGASIDVSESRKAKDELMQLNRTLNALGKSSQAMMHSSDESRYLEEVCRIISEDCGHTMVWIGYAEHDELKSVRPVAYYGFDEGYISKLEISWDDNEHGRGPTGTAIRTGALTVCRNMQADPAFKPWRAEALKRGYASSLVLPLIFEGKTFGAISIYSKETDAFTGEEITLLSNLASDLAYGISYIRLAESEKETAKIIRESEEKYRLLFESMIEGFALHEMILDENGKPCDYKFLSINPAFEKQTGIVAKNFIGRKVTEVLPGTEKYWIDTYGRVAMTGANIEFENYHSELNRYFRVSAFSPKKGYFATIFENITNRILAENELRSTKNYLENLINYANAPIIVWNTKNEITLFNHAFENLTGYSSGQVLGRELDFLFPRKTMKESREWIKSTVKENLRTVELPILTKDGEIRTVLWNSANIYDTDEKTVLSTIAQGNDITERRKAENEARLSAEKLDLALENARIGVWEWNIALDELRFDERLSRMFGLDGNDQFRGRFASFDNFIFEEDIAHFREAISNALNKNIPFDTVFRIRNRFDDFNHINTRALIESANGKPVKMTGVCFDITGMKKGAEQALFSLNENLARSNKELEQFAYVASHDLQEPLRMVSSFTQLLAMRYKDKLDDDANEFIAYAVDGAMRMQNLINDLLEYSRINTRGKSRTSVDMNDLLDQTLKNLSVPIREKNAIVTNDMLPVITADGGQIVQLLQNLIGNALKFCKNSPRINVSVREVAGYHIFSVKDNGIGIEPVYYEKIFKIFQRLHLKDEYHGTGIGLAICRRIAERHGGKIWVESSSKKGTTFSFSIQKDPVNN